MGPALHPMCSYLASFPAALAHAFIGRYSRRGDVVLDPFSGRGTTPLQACAEGRIGVGNDLNPLAHLLTAAKVEPATPAEAATRLAVLRLGWAASSADWLALAARGARRRRRSRRRVRVPSRPGHGGTRARDETVPEEVAVAFHARTLGQLLYVRTALRRDDRTDRFLAAALTGILHGKSASYLSELMPNTFSMAPRYVRDFAARTGFASPERDVFGGLEQKLARLHREPLPPTPGIALLGDARDTAGRARAPSASAALPERARLVVTSPPYLRVVKYGYYNWLRTWLLGVDARAIDAALDDAHHREPYLVFLREVLADLRGGPRRRCRRRARHRRRRDRPRAADPRRRRPRRAGLGAGRRARGLSPGRRRARRRRGRPQDDEAVGRRGGPGDEDGPDPRPRRDGGRPPSGARGGRDADRLGLAAARAAGPVIEPRGRPALDVVPIVHAVLGAMLTLAGALVGAMLATIDEVGSIGTWGVVVIVLPLVGIVLLGIRDWQVGRGGQCCEPATSQRWSSAACSPEARAGRGGGSAWARQRRQPRV